MRKTIFALIFMINSLFAFCDILEEQDGFGKVTATTYCISEKGEAGIAVINESNILTLYLFEGSFHKEQVINENYSHNIVKLAVDSKDAIEVQGIFNYRTADYMMSIFLEENAQDFLRRRELLSIETETLDGPQVFNFIIKDFDKSKRYRSTEEYDRALEEKLEKLRK
ncbi:MAG: hypothetical protein GX282_01210 [Campylobacteraceae bacterium]|nr:hypothetical protein [Campylobacteraceae bacterium]